MPTSSEKLAHAPRPFASDARGAMFLMGIPICLFMIGLLYFVIGLGEGLVLRERMQDAADSGALTAAIIHARGMNLIALINLLMAALVSLLVMVRMLQVLLLAAIGVASALAVPTWGASMSVVPPAAAGAEEAQAVWEELQGIIEPIVTVLHGFEVAVQYGQPAVAEARTILIVKKFAPEAQFGLVIPGDYPLPVQDGSWKELCGKAGEFAAKLITYPLEKLLPVPPVFEAISAASTALAESFAPLFCGGEGASSISIPEELPSVPLKDPISKNLPPLEKARGCEKDKSGSMPHVEQPIDPATGIPLPAGEAEEDQRIADQERMTDEKHKVCRAAAQETARAQPDDHGNPNTACNYNYDPPMHDPPTTPCEQGACLQNGVPCPEFQQKESTAAESACKPPVQGQKVTGYNYQRRQEEWTATLVPVGNCSDPDACKYTVVFESKLPQAAEGSEVFVKNDPKPPCGDNPKGTIGTTWNPNARWKPDGYAEGDHLCTQEHAVVDKAKLEGESAKTLSDWQSDFGTGWTLQGAGSGSMAFVGSWTAVTYIHSCESEIKDINQSQDYKDLAKKYIDEQPPIQSQNSSGSGGCGNGDEVNLTMVPVSEDNVLGGETYQMRCIAVRKGPEDKGARGVVRGVPLRLTGKNNEESADPLGPFGALTRFFAAQAEYYFDTTYNGPPDGPQEKAKDYTGDARDQWMWKMNWKARLRRLRFGGESGDSNSSSSSSASSNSSGGQGAGASCGTDTPSMNLDDAMSKAGGAAGDTDSLSLLETVEQVIIH